jgi:hypothetical protein
MPNSFQRRSKKHFETASDYSMQPKSKQRTTIVSSGEDAKQKLAPNDSSLIFKLILPEITLQNVCSFHGTVIETETFFLTDLMSKFSIKMIKVGPLVGNLQSYSTWLRS